MDGEKITDVDQTVLVQTGQVLKSARTASRACLPRRRLRLAVTAMAETTDGDDMAEAESQTLPEPTTAGGGAAHPPTDPALFEAEMNPHLDALYRNALRLTGNANDAEDLLQDTYLRAYRFFYQYQPGTNAKAWLFRIMNTVFLNDYRKQGAAGRDGLL